ncbi:MULTISPECIES: SGNH/GDSL hydrolase family protein [Clostridium]|uniref:Thermolabile hemolysin n=1 Tax=Clostridium botulinum D str. 1873 TaxID=592027 RepID=A0A9N7AT79_CLOBO|nr:MULTISPECIES: SGNH/GDSL hydrolase family protein [Clostridium]ACT33708.1 thermolabile hemolysin [Clostridium botulinum D str. 1873]AYF55423.1 thermolabile hemolysin [Clostridium novyi]MBO3441360.1 SGNH/GDSL hydrolase family protein [Clostridium haemolyticum]MCD3217405.1 SGNH/GDSL hydrolase family protein [Clostridium botulinum C]QPW56723.1 SGNH/GDSL hydrolase family protein [Clostridium botulinum]
MKKKFVFMFTIILTVIIVFTGTKYLKSRKKISEKITQVVAFGDSYSDNGQAKKISAQIMDNPNRPKEAYLKPSDKLYWNGRYSNGNTAVEVLAKKLDVPLTNYATGGATTGEKNYCQWMDYLGDTGLLGQVEKFKKSLKTDNADSHTLYFIFASANDYFKFMDYSMPGKIENIADKAVDNINTAVKKLAGLGAKKFFVVNSSDLSLVPYEITNNRTKSAEAFVNGVNKKLPESLKELQKNLNIKIMMFDLPKISDKIMKNPSKYGLVELKKECESTYPKIKPACNNQDQYYFWDEWHYSRAVHKILGEEMYSKVKMFK